MGAPRKLIGQHSEGADPLHQGFADFAQFDSQPDGDGPRKHGAFEIYRKPTPSKFSSPSLTLPLKKRKRNLSIYLLILTLFWIVFPFRKHCIRSRQFWTGWKPVKNEI